ncbi:SCO-spondin-like isoform X5 [Haliotis cracherodii]|uniref:SCO-spondin-like isoform X5 n=1 Tax=Haliotis cracherodii TaxID=6455 RepID=UPI0039EAF7F4
MLIYLVLATLAWYPGAQGNLTALNRDCHAIYDAVLVVDGSESIGVENFNIMKRALMEFVNTTLQTNEDVHIGVVLYSTAVTDTVNMTSDWAFLDDRINNMAYPAASTFTDHGIDAGTDMLLKQGRKVVPRIMIVVTDGLSTRPERTLEAAQRAKDNSITIYSVGIEIYVKVRAAILERYQHELATIASDEGHVIHLSDFNDFEKTAPEIAEKFCAVVAEVLTGLQNMTVYEGESFTLAAEMSHIAIVGGNWSRGGELLTAGGRYNISKNGSFLYFTVEGAMLSDAGDYTYSVGGKTAHGFVTVLKRWSDWSEWSQLRCRATCGINIIGDKERTRTCQKPECVGSNNETLTEACGSLAACDVTFTTELNNATVRGGGDFTLTAAVGQTDKTDWQWSKGGKVLAESNRMKFGQDGSGKYTLNVVGAETADEGEYTFTLGGKSTKGYVEVIAEILDGLKDIRVRQGDSFEQSVLLIGTGYSGWRWMKDGVALAESERIKFSSGDSSYRMATTGATLSDTGKYSFIVGGKTSEGTVTVYVDGGWSEWSAWKRVCSADCGQSVSGTDTRTRTCTNPAPVNNGSTCDGVAEEKNTIQCNTTACVSFTTELNNVTVQSGSDFNLTAAVSGTDKTDGQWLKGGKVLAESERMKFGQDGSGKYTLNVVGATAADGGEYTFAIAGKSTKGTVKVIVDGGWDTWTTWHIVSCSATCGANVVGVSRRVRYCDNPNPANGGKNCEGERIERNSTTCDLPECIILSGLKNLTLRVGEEMTLSAGTKASATGVAQWYRHGHLLHDSSRVAVTNDNTNYSLTLRNLTVGDTGTYTFSIEGQTAEGHLLVVADGGWSVWSDWNRTCSATCGTNIPATQRRTRTCDNPEPANGGNSCTGDPSEQTTAVCNLGSCNTGPVDGGWDVWTSWHITSCSATCGDDVAGVLRRVRYCDHPTPRNGGANCNGSRIQTNTTVCTTLPKCFILSGPQNMTLRSGQKLTLNVDVDESVHSKAEWLQKGKVLHPSTRVKIYHDKGNNTMTIDQVTVADSGAYTFRIEGQTADGYVTVIVDGGWGGWTEWVGSCTATCGDNITVRRTRSRACDSPAPGNGGNECAGSTTDNETIACDVPSCIPVVNGGWTEWSTVARRCSATCGQSVSGTDTRTRTCTNPVPSGGGSQCAGNASVSQSVTCPDIICPVNGGWSEWSVASRICDATCGQSVSGTDTKRRTCTNPAPAGTGTPCGAGNIQVTSITCSVSECPVAFTRGLQDVRVPVGNTVALSAQLTTAGHSGWSWMKDGVAVTEGARIKFSEDGDTYGLTLTGAGVADSGKYVFSVGGKTSEGTVTVFADGAWSNWASWRRFCLASCGMAGGVDNRTRACNNPAPSNGGASCTGEAVEMKNAQCVLPPCPNTVNGGWSVWTEWAVVCTGSCGSVPGEANRTRACDNPPPSTTGAPCPGGYIQRKYQVCHLGACNDTVISGVKDAQVEAGGAIVLSVQLNQPIETGWQWMKDGVPISQDTRSVMTRDGNVYRLTRLQSTVPDSGKYTFTAGAATSEGTVTVFVNGAWTEWSSAVRVCSATCGQSVNGTDTRTRTCTNPVPVNGGSTCIGNPLEIQTVNCPVPTCVNASGQIAVVSGVQNAQVEAGAPIVLSAQLNQPVETGWQWMKDGVPISQDTRNVMTRDGNVYRLTRLQANVNDTGNYTFIAGGATSEGGVFVYVNGGWTEWSQAVRVCSATCGQTVSGTDTRTRTCTNPVPVNGGSTCAGNPLDIQGVICPVPTCVNAPGQIAVVSGVQNAQVEAGGPIVLSAQLNQPVETGWQWMKDGVPISQDTRNVMTRDGNVYRLTRLQANVNDTGNYTFIAGGATSEGGVFVYVNGGWTEWSQAVRVCSATCGQTVSGTDTRTRTCTNPVPVNGGSTCAGNPLDIQGVICPVPTCVNASGQVAVVSGVQNARVEAGGPIVLSAQLNQPVETGWQWMKDGVPITRDTRNVMTRDGNIYRLTRLQANVNDTGNYTFIAGGATSEGGVFVYVNGGWTEWSPAVRVCSATCGQSVSGTDTRTRTCTNPVPVNGGSTCAGNPLDIQGVICPMPTCVNDSCAFNTADPDNPQGFIVTVGGTEYKLSCAPGTSYNPSTCLCDRVNGGWGNWSAYQRFCSGTCGSVPGVENRTRECNNPPPGNGGTPCAGESSDQRIVTCSLAPCSGQVAVVSGVKDTRVAAGGPIVLSAQLNQPVETGWQWMKDGVPISQDTRNVMTRDGNVYRLTRLQAAVPDTGKYTFTAGGATSEGTVTVFVNGGWTEWSAALRACSATCGQSVSGTDTRTRTCTNPVPVNGGSTCVGNPLDIQSIICQVPACATGWGQWSFWRRHCSATCGGSVPGVENRTRECLTQPCTGNPSEQRVATCTLNQCTGACSTNSADPDNAFGYIMRSDNAIYRVNCPDGNTFNPSTCLCNNSTGWGEWSFWRRYCSATCGGAVPGVENRTRECLTQPCTGNSNDQRVATCTLNQCPAVGAGWGEWSIWRRHCSATCGGAVPGVENRTRECLTQPCTGNSNDQRVATCTLNQCPAVGAGWGEWSIWRRHCSATCGGAVPGVENRTRECLTQPCTGNSNDQRVATCTLNQCPGVGGEWGPWLAWIPQCTGSCTDTNMSQSRRRTCRTTGCNGIGFEQRQYTCPIPPSCNGTVNGGWSVWGNWTRDSCSASCGGLVSGTERRDRRCDNPRPAANGSPCFGRSFEIKVANCSVPACPISQVGLCNEVFNASGVGYRYHPTACDKYLQCYYGPGGEVRGLYRSCPFGHHWDQLTRRCNHVWEVDCPMEKCLTGSVLSYAMDGNCRGYWSCDSRGGVAAECCPERYRYTARGCQFDLNCQDQCPSSCFGTGVCDKLPVWGNISKFQIDAGRSGWLSTDCPANTEFSILECACIKRRNHDCSPQTFVVFNEAFINSTSWVQAYDVNFQSNIAKFGMGRIDVDLKTTPASLQDPQVLFLRYREDSVPSLSRQVLVSGTNCNGKENLVIALVNDQLVFEMTSWLGTVHSVTMSTQGFPASSWKDVILMYNGNMLVGIIKSDKARFFTHTYAPKSNVMECGVTLGTDLTRTQNFKGEMTMLDIYQCDPNYLI